jgi:hypothetical protein
MRAFKLEFEFKFGFSRQVYFSRRRASWMILRMTLDYLDFDYSEDTEGVGVFDAMASTGPQQVAAVEAEVVQVLDWAYAAFGAPDAPVGDGGVWDYDLQGVEESSTPQRLEFDPAGRRLRREPGPPGAVRHTLSLSISGSEAFCAAFREAFALG